MKKIIVEHATITDVLGYINEEASDIMVIFDIDNTLVKPLKHLGGLHWHNYHTEQKARMSGNAQMALQETIELWRKIQPHISLVTVENDTARVLNEIQSRINHTLALTSRSPTLGTLTVERLKLCDISFAASGLEKKFIVDTSAAPYHYMDGVLFCGPYDKGKALAEILEQLDYRPNKIIFVDDILSHVENVQQAVYDFEKSIEFIGIRYSFLDDFAFDPELAAQELEKVKKEIL